MEIALLFRNERSAERAADEYDEISDFLEQEDDIDIEDTEADGRFVVGIAVFDFEEESSEAVPPAAPATPLPLDRRMRRAQ